MDMYPTNLLDTLVLSSHFTLALANSAGKKKIQKRTHRFSYLLFIIYCYSFILLVGRITSADHFEPKYATLIQNKDELKIPLLLETIPTAKEFKDAIESLSPEQQDFCRAFRSMQLGK